MATVAMNQPRYYLDCHASLQLRLGPGRKPARCPSCTAIRKRTIFRESQRKLRATRRAKGWRLALDSHTKRQHWVNEHGEPLSASG